MSNHNISRLYSLYNNAIYFNYTLYAAHRGEKNFYIKTKCLNDLEFEIILVHILTQR